MGIPQLSKGEYKTLITLMGFVGKGQWFLLNNQQIRQ